MRKTKFISIIMLVICYTTSSRAQFSGSNYASYQLGNLPDEEQGNRTNFYNQLNLQFRQENFALGLRMENYIVDEANEYNRLSQKYIRYQNDDLQITVGNFYEILGRGILLRGYEIPGSVYEDGNTRQRYSFYKDVDGFSLRFSNNWIEAKLLYGKPLNNVIPPLYGRKIRRAYLVQGGEVNFTLLPEASPGILFIRSEQNETVNEFGGFNFQGNMDSGIQYYLEYTQDLSDPLEISPLSDNSLFFRFKNKTARGFYGSVSYGINIVNGTFEYKDYNKYALGFNDPPLLSKEHTYSLLNRVIHSGEPSSEKGYQIEFLVNAGDLNTVTLNHAHTTNDLSYGLKEFDEYYGDFNYYVNENWLAKLFIDYAEDDLLNAKNRVTLGISSEDNIIGFWSYNTELQYQIFDRKYPTSPALNHNVENLLYLLSFNHAPDFSLSFSYEKAKDPLETNTLAEGNRLKIKEWYGLNLIYQYNQNNTASFFWGSRRGGNACVGGICYEVQPFEGIELNITSRF